MRKRRAVRSASRPGGWAGALVIVAACGTTATPPAATPTWTSRQPLAVPRFEGYGVVRQGRVAFIGGITGVLGDIQTANPSTRIDEYDPVSDAWQAGPPLPDDAPKHHLAVATDGNEIFVLTGFDGIIGKGPNEPFVPIGHAYALGATGGWRALAPPPLARGAATAQLIDGQIYVAGGAPNEGVLPYDELDVYDVAANTWRTGPPMPTAREHVASCAVAGRFLVVGGWVGPTDVASHAAEWFDPATNAWERLPDLPTARGGLAAVTGPDGRCHVLGGEDWKLPLPGTFATHEVFDPATRTWSTSVPMITARHGFGLALLGGTLYAAGGGPLQGNSYSGVLEAFVP